jgi:pilus assembly protein CpaF
MTRSSSDAQALRKNRRKHQRAKGFWKGLLETPDARFECRVLDLSAEGAQVRLLAPVTGPVVTLKEPVVLKVDRMGRFRGIVAWHRINAIGIHITESSGMADSAHAPAHQAKGSALAPRGSETAAAPDRAAEHSILLFPPGLSGEAREVHAREPSGESASAAIALTPRPARSGAGKADRARLDAAVAAVYPEILDRVRPEVAIQMKRAELEQQVSLLVPEIAAQLKLALSGPEQAQVCRRVLDEMVGFGPLEPLLADDTVADILVNGADKVFVERNGKLELTDIIFANDEHVVNVAMRIVTQAGRRVDDSSPLVDARLPDGSRINVVIPPLSTRGPLLSIRKFAKKTITLARMAQERSLSPAMAMLLMIGVRSRLNILISGGTGTGKTTLLNALSQMIDPAERVITIEDAAELQLQLPHVASLEARPPNLENKGEITMRDLFKNALRMRPDRIILGEVRGSEAFDMLQAMNSGHDGSLGTIHASGPRDALTRLENMVAMSGLDLPVRFVRAQIASAIHLVVQVSRMRDGKRRVTSIAEVIGMEGDVITTHELFKYRIDGESPRGELLGEFVSSSLRPHFMERAEAYGHADTLRRIFAAPEAVHAVELAPV